MLNMALLSLLFELYFCLLKFYYRSLHFLKILALRLFLLLLKLIYLRNLPLIQHLRHIHSLYFSKHLLLDNQTLSCYCYWLQLYRLSPIQNKFLVHLYLALHQFGQMLFEYGLYFQNLLLMLQMLLLLRIHVYIHMFYYYMFPSSLQFLLELHILTSLFQKYCTIQFELT